VNLPALTSNELEVCPLCGNFVVALDSYSGFCKSCSKHLQVRTCESCGKEFDLDGHNRSRRLCPGCRYRAYLEIQSNDRERLLAEGFELKQVKQILDSQKPKCISCGRSIAGATVGRHFFCTTTADCRYASGAYKRYRKKGFSKEDSLDKVVLRLKERRDGVLH